MTRFLFAFMLALLTGCASTQQVSCAPKKNCNSPVSSSTELVVWWGVDMRSGLEKGEETTSYALIP